MKLRLPNWIVDRLIESAKKRPFTHLDGYMERYWLVPPSKWLPFDIRIHKILRSDNDRHMHDHPWASLSWILRGKYHEEMPLDQKQNPALDLTRQRVRPMSEGCIAWRKATDRHMLKLYDGPVYSMFFMWTYQQKWGFYTPKGKVPHDQYHNILPMPLKERLQIKGKA